MCIVVLSIILFLILVNSFVLEKYYQWTITYNDISEKAEWTRTVYKWKAWYKTQFYVPIEFKKEDFRFLCSGSP